MEQTDIENFQKLGIIHLLAISGLHVGLISGMIYFSAIRLGVRRETILKVMLLLLPIYAFLTGAAPSVIRAVIMICFIIVTQLLKFAKLHPLNSICIAFLLFLFFKPFYIFYPGFQLSFLVSFSLIVSSSYILRRYKSTVSQLLVVSLIAQIVSLPIIAYHFYEISIFSTVMNIFFVPLFSMIILPLVIITFFLHLFSPFLSTPFILILTKLITFINKIAELFAQLPFATIVVGRPNSLLLASYFVVICTFLYNFEKTTNLYKNMRSFFLIIFVIIMQSLLLQYSPYGEVTFIDVGQGDSIFIKLPFNKGNYLIDTGGVIQYDIDQWERRRNQFDPGQHIIEPFLKSKGINRIDKLIISHGHLDHMGGAFYLVDNFKINEVVFPHVKSYTDVEKQFIQLIKENKIPLSIVKEGSKWQNDQAKFKVLAPTKETYHLMDQNNGSLVIFSKIGNLNWAFMGDLEEQGEKYLMKNNPNLNVDVLKVGHHGSNTSTSELLLNNINARYAVISAGINNRFGHPHDDVVARLNEKNIVIYRTDKNGSITYKFFYNRTGTFYKIIP